MLKTYPLEGQAGPGALHALSKTVITVWECELSKKNSDATIARIEADLRAAKEKYENGPPSAASREYAREQAFKHREVLAPVEAGLNLPKSLRRYAKKPYWNSDQRITPKLTTVKVALLLYGV